MNRREFVLLLCGAMSVPRSLRAQQKAMPVIGQLSAGSPPADLGVLLRGPIHQGVSELGFVEGQNIAWEYRWAERHYDRLPALAAELVERKVDVIVATDGFVSALAAKGATSAIPIVFTTVSDPVGFGLVASLARPGGNITGFSPFSFELFPKRVELISELVSGARVIALLANSKDPRAQSLIKMVEEAALSKGLEIQALVVESEREIDAAFATLVQRHAGRAAGQPRPALHFATRTDCRARGPPCHSDRLSMARICGDRRPSQLWTEHHVSLSPGRHLRR
jgi:putative tryptophan/tyrosine transport system substrate-binding protein